MTFRVCDVLLIPTVPQVQQSAFSHQSVLITVVRNSEACQTISRHVVKHGVARLVARSRADLIKLLAVNRLPEDIPRVSVVLGRNLSRCPLEASFVEKPNHLIDCPHGETAIIRIPCGGRDV